MNADKATFAAAEMQSSVFHTSAVLLTTLSFADALLDVFACSCFDRHKYKHLHMLGYGILSKCHIAIELLCCTCISQQASCAPQSMLHGRCIFATDSCIRHSLNMDCDTSNTLNIRQNIR